MINKIKLIIQSIIISSIFICSTAFGQDFSSKQELEKCVEMEVKGITDYFDNAYIIELTKKGGKEKWVLPLVIGLCEASAVTRSLEKTESTRPLTYDLLINIFTALNVKPSHVVITKLEEGTFYAVIVFQDSAGKNIVIDARPSDSINIALKAGIPIYTTQVVLDQAKEIR